MHILCACGQAVPAGPRAFIHARDCGQWDVPVRLTGWGRVPAALPGRVLFGDVSGCDDPDCPHNSHDPAAPTWTWEPPEGTRLLPLTDGDTLVAVPNVPKRGRWSYWVHGPNGQGWWTSVHHLSFRHAMRAWVWSRVSMAMD